MTPECSPTWRPSARPTTRASRASRRSRRRSSRSSWRARPMLNARSAGITVPMPTTALRLLGASCLNCDEVEPRAMSSSSTWLPSDRRTPPPGSWSLKPGGSAKPPLTGVTAFSPTRSISRGPSATPCASATCPRARTSGPRSTAPTTPAPGPTASSTSRRLTSSTDRARCIASIRAPASGTTCSPSRTSASSSPCARVKTVSSSRRTRARRASAGRWSTARRCHCARASTAWSTTSSVTPTAGSS